MRLLTVGDGDFSCSLALKRAYGDQIDLTASTLLSSAAEVCASYPDSAAAVLHELVEVHHSGVWYGVDATRLETILHQFASKPFDLILFHHPHLGYDTVSEDEAGHTQRHHILLSHYLHSSFQCLTRAGKVHLCLCGTQEFSWNLEQIVRRLSLEVRSFPASQPIISELTPLPVNNCTWRNNGNAVSIPAPRRYRNGGKKGGSKHWLGKYGYRHQLVEKAGAVNRGGSMNVLGSKHFLFRRTTSADAQIVEMAQETVGCADGSMNPIPLDKDQGLSCGVCGVVLSTIEEFRDHQAAPAAPLTLLNHAFQSPGRRTRTNDECRSTSRHARAEKSSIATFRQSSTTTLDPRVPERGAESIVVSREANGKRLRCFLQHDMQSHSQVHLSKRQVQNRIRDGCVRVNDEVVRESGRVLREGDTIVIGATELPCSTVHLATSIRVLESWSDSLHVVIKPVGMRSTSTGRPAEGKSLEDCFSLQQGRRYISLSKLDRGCWGLSVLQDKSDTTIVTHTHSFIALVHGRVPEFWRSGGNIDLPVDSIRRWRGNKTAYRPDVSGSSSSTLAARLTVLEPPEAESLTQMEQALSTVQVDVTQSSSMSSLASVISYSLRQMGHPVVGDRFACEEYLTLPRAMRNRLKQKLCLGCVEVRGVWNDENSTCSAFAGIPAPDKWKVSHWQKPYDK